MAKQCRCGAALPPQDGPGRPRRYCSKACRRVAETERARVERLLETLEGRRIANRLQGTTGGAQLSYVDAQDVALTTEIDKLETRLRALYDTEGADHGR